MSDFQLLMRFEFTSVGRSEKNRKLPWVTPQKRTSSLFRFGSRGPVAFARTKSEKRRPISFVCRRLRSSVSSDGNPRGQLLTINSSAIVSGHPRQRALTRPVDPFVVGVAYRHDSVPFPFIWRIARIAHGRSSAYSASAAMSCNAGSSGFISGLA